VTDWKRIIVGDAFKLSSRNPRYYTDILLMWPTLVFGMRFAMAVWNWPPASWDRREVLIWGGLLALGIVLLKERVFVVIGGLGAIVVGALWGMHFHPDKSAAALTVIVGCVVGMFVLFWPNRFRTNVYGSTHQVRGTDMLGLICGVAGIGLAILIARWVRQ